MRTPDGLVRINRQGEDFFIETQNVAPPDSRIELISAVNTDWNALQSSLLKLRLSFGG
ncbi:protein YeiR [Enterobacter cloacae]|nr:protein YeiR [Enterobacter cloacae]